MDRELNYGRTRFSNALALLEGRGLPRGWPDTANNRLRFAFLEVFGCVSHHFVRRSDYDAFAQILLDVSVRVGNRRVLPAITAIPPDDAVTLMRRLTTLALNVCSQPLESERFGKPLPPDTAVG